MRTRGEVPALGGVEVRYRGGAAASVDVRLVGEVGVEGDEGDEVLALDDHAAAVFELLGEEVAVEAGARLVPVAAGRFELLFRAGGDEGVGVDLAVRVVQRDAYGLALVLEDEDVLDERQRAELLVSVGPDLDEVPDAPLRHGRERGVVVVRVQDDLADPAPRRDRREGVSLPFRPRGVRGERGELVLEDHDVVGLSGDFGREAPGFVGSSGQYSAGGRKVRSWRCVA